jgi:hypothetical protein
MLFTVGLHLLAVLIYFISPYHKIVLTPPAKEGEMVYITPGKPAPQPKPKAEPKAKPAKETPRSSRAYLPPNKNAITEVIKPQEKIVPPEQAKLAPPPEKATDMQELIEMRRRARGADAPQPSQEEDAGATGRARAMANIMGAQGRAANGDRNDTGGMFQIVNQTFNAADIKFRGFSTNFKRTWQQQVHVDQGSEKDIETAIVKRMIEMIRKEKPGDFIWESHRLGRNVPMSARKEDEKELAAFLLQEMFPGYGKINR